ncbi:MAG: DUF503 domain-containing protein [Synergistes sp.]|nr:DUF503 domain-containing protein [Synergistes sp.]MCR5336060.1 DUF503 domain-containing protein [Synergistes sp.]
MKFADTGEDSRLWLAAARLFIEIPYAESLKDRRHIVRSVTDGARSRFALSAADLGPDGEHKKAVLGFAFCGSSQSELRERMANLEKYLFFREEEGEFEIVRFSPEVFNYDDIPDRQDK